jgi:hypothetical protein
MDGWFFFFGKLIDGELGIYLSSGESRRRVTHMGRRAFVEHETVLNDSSIKKPRKANGPRKSGPLPRKALHLPLAWSSSLEVNPLRACAASNPFPSRGSL